MAVKSWNPGDVLTAADMDAWAVPLAAIKAGDTSRTSTTTLANDPDLSLTYAGPASYRFWLFLDYEGGTAGASDLKFTFVVGSGTLRWTGVYTLAVGGPSPATIQTGSTLAAAATAGTVPPNLEAVTLQGTLVTTAPGTLTLQWAQNTSSATSTILHAQSAMVLDRIG